MKKINSVATILALVSALSFSAMSLAQEEAKNLNWVDHEPNPRFAIHDPGTPADLADDLVLDKQTGIIWARDANLAGKPMTWEDAITYCQNLQFCNVKGWRLPNKDEVSSLIDPSQNAPALPKGHPFVNMSYTYWTRTTYEDFSADAYYVHFAEGAVRAYTKHMKYDIWPVLGKR